MSSLAASSERAALVAIALILAASGASRAAAQPVLRQQMDVRGDFALIGNTLGHDCGSGVPAPVVGAVGTCGSNTTDSSPDIFWRADAPAAGQAQANNTVTVANARSTAVLQLPAGATVRYARLYWSAHLPGGVADTAARVERPGVFTEALTADVTRVSGAYYQSSADVTALVAARGNGAFRVDGVDAVNLVNLNENVTWAAWWMVVFYEDPTQPTRNLALFDGLDRVDGSTTVSTVLAGFLVPVAGFTARLGVVAYEGDDQTEGDTFRFRGFSTPTPPTLVDADRLNNGVSPINNFFSSSRTRLGAAVSVTGDLPQLTGGRRSMSSFDIHEVDVTARVAAGQERAAISANSSGDVYYLGGFVTSISTLLPDFTGSTKSVSDVNGGDVVAGDTIEYTIDVTNTGNDTSVGTVLEDQLPAGVSFVPGSLRVVSGANAGVKTDAAGDDQAEYVAATRRVRFRLGTGANATVGGTMVVGATTRVSFRVTVNAGFSGTLQNQASVSAAGLLGGPQTSWPTDGNGSAPGAPPTTIIVNECTTDAQCAAPDARCDTAASPRVCVRCTSAAHCDDGNPCTADACAADRTCTSTPVSAGTTCPGGGVCSGASAQCVQCIADAQCGGATPRCQLATNTCVQCLSAAHCDDANPCTTDACSSAGTCAFAPVAPGVGCPGGVCSGAGAQCVECVADAQCGGTTPRCDPASNVCVRCLVSAECDDGNECTADACGAGACSSAPVAPGTPCSTGACSAGGTCVVVSIGIVTPADGSTVGSASVVVTGVGTPGVTVRVEIDGAEVGMALVGPDGTWSLALVDPLSEGEHVATATVVGAGGTATDSSTFRVDLSTEVAITGPADGSTTLDSTPDITGTGEPGAEVVVTIDGAEVGRTTVAEDGTWRVTPTSPLANGPYTAIAVATDAVGNTASAESSFTVDAQTEVRVTSPASGSATRDTTPTITGTAVPGATVEVRVGDVIVGTTTAAPDGTWSVDVTEALPEGSHTVTATATDPAGNRAEDSSTFTVDTSTTVTITSVDPATGTVRGTGEPGATVVVTRDGATVGTVTVGEDGTWTLEGSGPLAPGTYTYEASASDRAGNEATDSRELTVDAMPDAGTTDGGAGTTDGGVMPDGGALDGGARPPGRYAGGGLCAVRGGSSSPWLGLGLAMMLAALARRRRRG